MAESLDLQDGAMSTDEQPYISEPELTPFRVLFNTLDTSLTVRLPGVHLGPEQATRSSDCAVGNAVKIHETWKKSMLAWNDSSAASVVLAMAYAFPDLDDEKSLAGMAATYVVGCEMDDAIEEMDLQTATDCIRSSVAILDRGSSPDEKANDPGAANKKVCYLSQIYHQHIHSILGQKVAKAVMTDMKRFLLGQLGEVAHRCGDSTYDDFSSYLNLRKDSIGMAPLLAIVEHYCLGSRVVERDYDLNHPGIDNPTCPLAPLKESMARLSVLQNDIAGLEKDVWTSNRCNSALVLTELTGTRISRSAEQHKVRKFLPRLVAEHDRLLLEIVNAWKEIQKSPTSSAEERLFSTIVLKLTVLHFRWACSARRYNVEQTD